MIQNKTNKLPDGFVLDESSQNLPDGFVLDTPPKKQFGFFGSVPSDAYNAGERNIAGNISERPAAAIRAFLQAPMGGKIDAYKKASVNPTDVPTFQDQAIAAGQNSFGGPSKSVGVNFLKGLIPSAAGLAADMASDPSNVLTAILPKAPVGGRIPQFLAKQVGKTRYTLEDVTNQGVRKAAPAIQEASGRVVSKLQKSPETLSREATAEYRNILQPSKADLKKIEISKRDDINRFYKMAAEEGVSIKRSPDKKLDTLEAIDALQPKISEIHDELNTALESSKTSFNLNKVRGAAKSQLKDRELNAKELAQAQKHVDDYINAEIDRHGETVNAKTLNTIKQGMWSVAYNDEGGKTAYDTARTIGNVIRKKIEDAFPAKTISYLNRKSGDYQTLISLLRTAHGRPIQGGRIGKFVAQGIGSAAGSHIPFVGPILGAIVGGKVSEAFYNPEWRALKAAGKMQKAMRRMPPAAIDAEIVYPSIGSAAKKQLGAPAAKKALAGPSQLFLPKPKAESYQPKGVRETPPGSPIEMGAAPDIARKEKAAEIKANFSKFKESAKVREIQDKARQARINDLPPEMHPLANEALKHKNADDFIDAVVVDKKGVNLDDFKQFYEYIHGEKSR